MFLQFRIIWGEKWTRNIDDSTLALALHEWGDAIRELSDKQISNGIKTCRSSMIWPPSIAEFIEICKSRTTGFQPNSNIVVRSFEKRQPMESPLKRWYLEQEELKRAERERLKKEAMK